MDLLSLLPVVLLSLVEIWAAIPAGLALKVNPFVLFLVVSGGAIVSVFVVAFLGEPLRTWLMKRTRKGEGGKYERIGKLFATYGIIGLGLLSPLLTGAPLGTALGLAFGGGKARLIAWMSVGIILWTAALVLIGISGMAAFGQIEHGS